MDLNAKQEWAKGRGQFVKYLVLSVAVILELLYQQSKEKFFSAIAALSAAAIVFIVGAATTLCYLAELMSWPFRALWGAL